MKTAGLERPVRVGLVSLGCAKNLVDAEIMLGTLIKDGVEITNEAAEADVLILNTCSFIDSAQEESVDAILESAQCREATNRGQGLIVAGCLPQRFRDELPKLLPEVDAFMGIDQVGKVTDLVRLAMRRRQERLARARKRATTRAKTAESAAKGKPARQPSSAVAPEDAPLVDVDRRPRFIPDFATPRFRLTPKHFAYVKIAEGCNHPCSFCIIPRMRGSHRSRSQDDVVREARRLIADGVRELNLISQDSTYYGLDLRPNRTGAIASPEKFRATAQSLAGRTPTLSTLLRELNALPGDFWIRLLYSHPAHWTEELIETIAACPKVARYVDMPLQHIHHTMLERMRRETSEVYIRDLMGRIRAGIPGIALRTTFIVGFPGETEAYFQRLLDFIGETAFERLGVFTYSREAGTRAGQMAGQIPEDVKEDRRRRAMAAQQEVARKVARASVGRVQKVLVEKAASARELREADVRSWEHGLLRKVTGSPDELKGPYRVARGEADAPDIDGRVYIRGNELPLGEFASVRIVGHTDYDLFAEPA